MERPVLHLNLKRKWFEMIRDGIKTDEYRGVTRYWNRVFKPYIKTGLKGNRFSPCYIKIKNNYYQPHEIIICFSNGYSKSRDQFYAECIGVCIDYGKQKWGAEKGKIYFKLSLGNLYV